jgi:hypothetical protein
MRLDSSGNLGIGVTPSAWSVYKALQIGRGSLVNASTETDLVHNAFWNGTNWIYIQTDFASRHLQINGQHRFFTAASGTAGNAITFTQAMTLDASGNLQLASGNLYTATTSGIFFSGAVGSYTNGIYGIGTNNVAISTNGSERARIDSSGNLLVGKTASGLGSNGFNAQPDGYISCSLAGSTSATDTLNVYSTGASAYRFYVDMGGTIHATSIVITAISDERLKENVRDIDTGLDSIMALKPRRFDWIDGKGQNKKNAAGFIAQEFENVFPECVGTSKAGEDGVEYKNINHETLIPSIVKALQELNSNLVAQVAALSQRLAALENS